MVSEKDQIRAVLLYEFRRGANAAEAYRNIAEVFGESSTSESSYQKWFQEFRRGDFNLADEPRSGRPSVVDGDVLRLEIR